MLIDEEVNGRIEQISGEDSTGRLALKHLLAKQSANRDSTGNGEHKLFSEEILAMSPKQTTSIKANKRNVFTKEEARQSRKR
jgi:hypothetical protein